MWRQKSGRPPEYFCCWDYHVILLEKVGSFSYVWDLDRYAKCGRTSVSVLYILSHAVQAPRSAHVPFSCFGLQIWARLFA